MSSEGLFAPLPLRRDTELGRLLIALDVPDCKCKPETACLSGVRGYPEECPSPHNCTACPLKACGCGQSSDHALTIEEWTELLHAYDDRGYSDPPLPDGPEVALTKESQLAVVLARAHSGRAMRHPEDLFATTGKNEDELDHLSIQGQKRLRQGNLLATYHEGDSDEEIEEQRHLNRVVDSNDRIAMRALALDQAAARAAEALAKRKS